MARARSSFRLPIPEAGYDWDSVATARHGEACPRVTLDVKRFLGDVMRCVGRLVAVGACVLAAPVNADPVCHQLDVPGATWTQLWQINNRGGLAAGADTGGFVFQDGHWAPLPAPPADSGYTAADVGAGGINDAGEIVGGAYSEATGETSAFTLQGGAYAFFVDPDVGEQADARSVSNAGLVAGRSLDTFIGWVYNPGPPTAGYASGFTTIYPEQPDGTPADFTLPGTMNDAGVLVGSAWFFSTDTIAFAFINDPAQGAPSLFQYDGLPTSARGINARGTIVGFVSDPSSGSRQIFVRRGDSYQLISCADLLGTQHAGLFAEAINDAGLISAQYNDANGNSHGAIVYPDVVLPVHGRYAAPVEPGAAVFVGARLARAYLVDANHDSPPFSSVTMPFELREGAYTVAVENQRFSVPAGGTLDFTAHGFPDGVRSFRVLDVAPPAGTADGPAAFVAQLAFTQAGRFDGRVQPLGRAP